MPYTPRQAMIEKQHTCVGCGCVFRYAIDPADWRSHVMSQTTKPKDSIRIHPCPDCGLYQPEMVMWMKTWHPALALVALLAIPVLGAIGMTAGGANAVLAAQIGIAVFLALALVQFATATYNPNGDLKANLEVARKEMKERCLERHTAGEPGSGSPPRNFGFWHVPGLLMLLAGPAAFVLVILALSDRPELPTNPDLNNAVITPGQTVHFTFNKSTAEGVTGTIWRGQPTVRVQNARSLGIPETLPAKGSEQQWGDKFSVRKGAGNQPIKPMISFGLPNDEKLVGKTVRISVSMQMTYPVMHSSSWMMGSSTFVNDSTSNLSETVAIKVADPASVEAMQKTYLVGLAGAAVSLVGGIWLTCIAWALLRHASKCEVVAGDVDEAPSASACAPHEPAASFPGDWRCPAEHGLPATPALDNFDRSKWGERKLR